ncbi:MAG: hypothetical protein DIU65_08880 [Proteobacteria bacterium]|nr:MAG: hypothetical protein DIU65_08880 [Pseudomonadota bacterium]
MEAIMKGRTPMIDDRHPAGIAVPSTRHAPQHASRAPGKRTAWSGRGARTTLTETGFTALSVLPNLS